jgi:hypothetical protein
MRQPELPVSGEWPRSFLRPSLLLAAAAFAGLPGAGNVRASTEAASPANSAQADASAKGGGFAIRRHAIAGGGGSSSGGAFTVAGTVGQADADPLQPSTGGVFGITGGFWPGTVPGAPQGDALFANGFEPPPP